MKKKIIIISIVSILLFICLFLCARFIGTKGLKVKEYKLTYENLINDYHGLKIVHFSDLHYYSIIKEKELEKVVNEINKLKPDIVVFSGDLFTEKDIKIDLNKMVNILKKIECNLKYAVTGNHDASNNENFNFVMNNSNFKILQDEYELIYINSYTPVLLLGMSSSINNSTNIEDRFNSINDSLNIETALNILLLHEPDYIDKIDYSKFNLILSGHSHNGQVRLPIIGKLYTPLGAKKYYGEYYKLNDTDLYISSGIGTTLYNIRFFNKPSINFYRITNK